MKRRLNILCIIIMLVLCYSVLEVAYYMGQGIIVGARTGWRAGTEVRNGRQAETNANYQELANMKLVGLIPHALNGEVSELLSDSVYNAKSGQHVPAVYTMIAVSVKTQESGGLKLLSGLLGIFCLVTIVWAIVLFVRIIVAINRSDIFNWRNVRRLRQLGVLLIISFGSSLLSEYLMLCNLREVFALQNYDLSISEVSGVTTFVLGLTALMVAEVFAIGLRMKEEQELTI